MRIVTKYINLTFEIVEDKPEVGFYLTFMTTWLNVSKTTLRILNKWRKCCTELL